jgi:hypothetical protein
MREPPSTSLKVPSPPKVASRVEDGKVKKPKASYKSEIPAVQHINGKTYACESCKRGHRVHKCDHGKTRPISETNQPGRPSAGTKRGCHCPRNCACTTKTCKCERNCACTQEMFLVVRLDNPGAINRDSTSTPKPIWEDADGTQLTLKKVWADANGKEINDEEYEARQRLKKEREEAAKEAPKSSCCGTDKVKTEPESPKGGCRHRQNVAAIQPHPGPVMSTPTPQVAVPKILDEPWMSTCSCGSACSCLYCPDHPNNATSINHAQQQVKSLAEQAYTGGHSLTPVPSHTENTSRSCMGGQPSFFLSSSANVSQHQLQQFFPDAQNPNAIYLAYPIQQHSWTNRPLSSHCSHSHSPPAMMTSPDPQHSMIDPLSDMSTPLHIPHDVDGVWDFTGNQLGDSSFSWTGIDASYGTDYNIGQATVATISHSALPISHGALSQQPATLDVMPTQPMMGEFSADALPQLDENAFLDFDVPLVSNGSESTTFIHQSNPNFNTMPIHRSCCGTPWNDFQLPDEHPPSTEPPMSGIALTNSPILNHV